MSPAELLAEVGKGKFRPAYYFYGTEDFRLVEAEKFLARQFLPDLQLTTNYHRLDGRKASFAEISAELSGYPMLGERLVVSVSEVQKFTPTQLDQLERLLVPPDANRLVILSTPSARAPRKDAAILKRMVKLAEVVEFNKLTPQESQNQIVRGLAKAGLKIDAKALSLFVESVAGNRGGIEQETNKLISYKSSGETVTVEDIRAMVPGYEIFIIWELANEIVAGDTSRVLKQVQSLLADGNSPTGILFFISKHFLELYLVKNGKPLEPKRRWLAWRYREQTRKFENTRLERMILASAATDVQMRKNNIRPDICLEMLAVELMQA